MPKPIVLELDDGLRHVHEFYNSTLLARFDVVRGNTRTREEFITALKSNNNILLILALVTQTSLSRARRRELLLRHRQTPCRV